MNTNNKCVPLSPPSFKRVGKICADEHDRVLYNGEQCPVCVVKSELHAANRDISHLEVQIYELEGKLENA
jgi:hypothetical protein